MSTYDFMVSAKKAICAWLQDWYSGSSVLIKWEDINIVWQCKTLQNHKAILAAPTPDKFLFECTYNGDKKEMYLDVYDKKENVVYQFDSDTPINYQSAKG